MGQDGFDNEILIIEYLNGKKFGDLNENMQKFIKYIFTDSLNLEDNIFCIKKGGSSKSDLIIEANGRSCSVSIKKGTGNSIHQEKVEEFIGFLKETYNISEEFANDLRLFIWGDGTFDGTGPVSKRINAPTFKQQYPKVVDNLKKFFYAHKKDLIERFLIKGPKSRSAPDFIYYGTYEKGSWKDSMSVLNWLCDDAQESTRAPIPVGKLTFQAWNRNIKGGNKSEHKRGVIQLKWGSIGKDLEKIMDN